MAALPVAASVRLAWSQQRSHAPHPTTALVRLRTAVCTVRPRTALAARSPAGRTAAIAAAAAAPTLGLRQALQAVPIGLASARGAASLAPLPLASRTLAPRWRRRRRLAHASTAAAPKQPEDEDEAAARTAPAASTAVATETAAASAAAKTTATAASAAAGAEAAAADRSRSQQGPEDDASSTASSSSAAAAAADSAEADADPASSSWRRFFADLDATTVKQIGVLGSTQFLLNSSFGVVIPVLPIFASEFGLGATGVGLILSAPSVARLLLNMPCGRMADTRGRKPLMVAGTLITAMGATGTGAATSIATVLPARMLVGVGSAASMAGSQAYVADVTAKLPAHRAKILGIQQTAVTAAFVAGPAMGGYLAEFYGANVAFYIIGAASACCSLFYSWLPETVGRSTSSAPGSAADKSDAPKMSPSAWLPLLKSRQIQGVVAMNLAVYLGYAGMLTVLPLRAAEVWGAGAGQLGALYSVISVLGFAGTPLGGWVADRFGRKAAIVPAAAAIVSGCALLGLAPTQETFIACTMLWSLGNSVMNPGLMAFTVDVAPNAQRGQVLSLSRQAGDVSFLLGPVCLGMLADATSIPLTLGITASVIASGAAFFALRTTESKLFRKSAAKTKGTS